MKQTGFWMVVIVLLLAGVFPALAQDVPTPEVPDFFAGLPECTNQQSLDALYLLQDEYVPDYQAAADLSAHTDAASMMELAKVLDAAQQRWWAEVAPQFPACAASMRIMFAVGQSYDEFLVATLLAMTGDADLIMSGSAHLEILGSYQSAIFDEVAALAE